MIKKFCDCCGEEMHSSDARIFSYGVHLDRLNDGGGYIFYPINFGSDRDEAWDTCNHCYNKVMIESVKLFHEIRDDRLKSENQK